MRPTFSIVVEMENALRADAGRVGRTLRTLRLQIAALDPPPPEPPEIVVLYDGGKTDAATLDRVLGDIARDTPCNIRTRTIRADGLRYFQQKNLGAREASGEIVIQLDSDVVPRDGWLRELLASFADPSVQVVGGQAVLGPLERFYDRAFSLIWLYSPRPQGQGLVECHGFWPNNVAFRREVILAHPFPDLPAYRLQGPLLARELGRAHIPIHRQHGCVVDHPAIDGAVSFAARALWHGYDNQFKRMRRHDSRRLGSDLAAALSTYRRRLKRFARRARHERRDAGLVRAAVPAAAALALAFWSLMLVGQLVAIVRPEVFARRLRS